MYLTQVLNDVQKESAPPNTLHAEHLFKLNEAVFNLAEEDRVDSKMASKLFLAVERVRKAYGRGRFDDSDGNFFYDYLALLGTMQNQHFFSQEQTEKLLAWIREAVDTGGAAPPVGAAPAKDPEKRALETENEKLRQRLAKYEGRDEPRAKAKGKAAAAPAEAAPPVRDTKGKGKGKGKADYGKGGFGKGDSDRGGYGSKDGGYSKGKGKGKGDRFSYGPQDDGRVVYVGNLPFRASWQDLKDEFKQHGEVIRVEIAQDADGVSKGYATVLFERAEDAESAVNALHDVEFQGRSMKVRMFSVM